MGYVCVRPHELENFGVSDEFHFNRGLIAIVCSDQPLLSDLKHNALREKVAWKVDRTVLQKIDSPALLAQIRRVGMPFDNCTA